MSLDARCPACSSSWYHPTPMEAPSAREPAVRRLDETFRYCRGFLASVGEVPKAIPAGYRQVSQHLWVASDVEIAEARASSTEVSILGIAVDTSPVERAQSEIANYLCQQLAVSEEAFLEATKDLAGRYLILFRREHGPLRLVGDACGTRPIVFSGTTGIAAMHAKLVADNVHGASVAVTHTRYRSGHPGRATPYPGVLLLTPNTILTLESGSIERYYPRTPLTESTVSVVVDEILARLGRCLRALGATRRLLLSLTGGRDSRATLSAALAAGVGIEAFTYVTADRSTRTDANRARELCTHLGISHETVVADADRATLRDSFAKVMKENTYSRHGYLVYQQALEAFGNRNVVHIRSNLVEIGRGFWAGHPVDAGTTDGMVELFAKMQRREISAEERARLTTLFEDFRVSTDFTPATRLGVDARQLFYWEHRMASWLSQLIIEGDPAFETVHPWNCRQLLQALLSVSWAEQQSGAVVDALIRHQDLHRWPVG